MVRILTIRNKTLFAFILLIFAGGCALPSWFKPLPEKIPIDLSGIEKQLYEELRLWQGTPYAHGGNDSSGIDCSGFVLKVYEKRFGIRLPRDVIQQAKVGFSVSKAEIRAGDLVFFSKASKISHVGIYLKDGNFAHASTTIGVTVSSLEHGYWKKAYQMSRRILQ